MTQVANARTILALVACLALPAQAAAVTQPVCPGSVLAFTEPEPEPASAPDALPPVLPETAPADRSRLRDPAEVLVSLALFERAERVRLDRIARPALSRPRSAEPRGAPLWTRLVARVASVLPRQTFGTERTAAPENLALVGLPPALPLFVGGLVFAAILGRRRSRR